ncbi:helix-turn-helix domain-containing protein [Candidatus Contubernalis alkaliaceticus]|uniref:helix-turn-helix domain-containing protein n=1 Tax=Candidatus Contubernalis alkaliaceticus TaxID=338645 RepID=UPI001F4BF428|nr:MerR family transcriptional regulator [Candidatus Contubernalis alkalaceticus]UNC93229.1 MerR family transcriptional regulator [Candidatus Contubernalis alkalaceticus]
MRKFLTIGEVATLLNLTTSQIRFYEKKGLLMPRMIDENGYRLYSYKELDTLEIIVTFRKLNLSISEIKEIIQQKNDYNFLELLDKAAEQIEEKMTQLRKTLITVNKLRKSYKDFITDTEKIIHYPNRTLYIIDNDITIDKTEKEVHDFIQKYDLDYTDHTHLLFTIFTDSLNISCLYNCKENKQLSGISTYELEEGYYFCLNIDIGDYSEMKKAYKLLLQKCRNAGYEPIGEYIAIEDLTALSFSKTRIYLTLQTKIKSIDI